MKKVQMNKKANQNAKKKTGDKKKKPASKSKSGAGDSFTLRKEAKYSELDISFLLLPINFACLSFS